MGSAVLETIRQDLRNSLRAAHYIEMVPFGHTTAAELLEHTERFADDLVEHTDDLSMHANERGFATLFAALERVRRAVEAASAVAYNAADERGIHHADGHRSPQAFLQASANLSNRERIERRHVAALVKLCPQVRDLLADGTLPVGHAVALGQLVANDRIDRDQLSVALSGFLLTANLVPHDVFAKRVREWGRLHDFDGTPPDAEASHRNRNVRLSNVLDAFVLEGRFGAIQGAKMKTILDRFVDIEFDRDWQQARERYGDQTSVKHLRRTPGQRRADALEAIFLAATGQGTAKDVDIIINIVTDTQTFTDAATNAAQAANDASEAAPETSDTDNDRMDDDSTDDDSTDDDSTVEDAADVPAADEACDIEDETADDTTDTTDAPDAALDIIDDESPDAQPSEPPRAPAIPKARRRFCHTLDGIEINPLAALQAALDGHIRALIVGTDGVIINQGRKRRLFTGNTRTAAKLQAGLDNLTRCSWPGCRANPRHIDHATEWAGPDAGRTDVANASLPCVHHNLWKSKHGYTVRRDEHGNLRTYRLDGTELHPY